MPAGLPHQVLVAGDDYRRAGRHSAGEGLVAVGVGTHLLDQCGRFDDLSVNGDEGQERLEVDPACDKETYLAHLARVEEELTLARIDRYDTEVEEFDIEGTLAFAEHLVSKSSRLWTDQRQRLQRLFFPEGLSYDGQEFRTPVTCPFFRDLEGTSGRMSGNGGAEGIRTLDPHVANVVLSQLSYRPTEDRSKAAPSPGVPANGGAL